VLLISFREYNTSSYTPLTFPTNGPAYSPGALIRLPLVHTNQVLFSPSSLKILQYISPLIAYSIRARASVRNGFPSMIELVQCSSMKKLVLISILPIIIGTPHTMPAKPLVKLFTETIFAKRMLLGIEVIGSMAFSAVARFIVFSSAPKSNKLRN
jgi:hypothetical protein